MARQNKLLLNIDQNTTNEEKAIGRHNLGLADVAHTGSYNDLSDKIYLESSTEIKNIEIYKTSDRSKVWVNP